MRDSVCSCSPFLPVLFGKMIRGRVGSKLTLSESLTRPTHFQAMHSAEESLES